MYNTDRIGIDCLSVFGLPPVRFVNLVADIGCRYISIGLKPTGANLSGFPDWSLRDKSARREMITAMDDRGVSVALGEGLAVLPGKDVSRYSADLEAMCELGVPVISTVSVDPDKARSLDQFAKLADMAQQVGIRMAIEFVPVFTIATLDDAVSAVRHIGKDKAHVLVDVMHLIRSGASAADLAVLDTGMIAYAQLCDAPLSAPMENYLREAMFDRKIPGTGELPLTEFLAVLPEDITIGLEMPLRPRLDQGEDLQDLLSTCLQSGRALLEQARAME